MYIKFNKELQVYYPGVPARHMTVEEWNTIEGVELRVAMIQSGAYTQTNGDMPIEEPEAVLSSVVLMSEHNREVGTQNIELPETPVKKSVRSNG